MADNVIVDGIGIFEKTFSKYKDSFVIIGGAAMFRKLYIKCLVRHGKAVDIWHESEYPANALSNLCKNNFMFDGVFCRSMESFLQSLKYQDRETQKHVCDLDGDSLRKYSTSDWQKSQTLWWRGKAIGCHSPEFIELVRRAYNDMFLYSYRFRNALFATEDKKLYYSHGKRDPSKAVLTEQEFCEILTDLRTMVMPSKYKIYPRIWPNCIGVDEDYE